MTQDNVSQYHNPLLQVGVNIGNRGCMFFCVIVVFFCAGGGGEGISFKIEGNNVMLFFSWKSIR